jgi:BirA family biotin operon repressor/biotin-[acetyl-CoA-carboxylase] ligase
MESMQEYRLRSPINNAPVYYTVETDSTMADARKLVSEGASSGTVILTGFQRAGRGRLPGRRWVAPPGTSLMFTVCIANDPEPAAMPLRAGAAVADALQATHGIEADIKWPNDVLVDGRKIAGILCEYSAPWLYVGMGINLTQEHFPPELAERAISVAGAIVALGGEAPADTDRDALLLGILTALGDSGADWREKVNGRLWRRGRQIQLVTPDGSRLIGTLEGVGPDGTLSLRRSGSSVSVAAGEILWPESDGRMVQ